MISDDCKFYGGTVELCDAVLTGLKARPIADHSLSSIGGFYRAHLIFPSDYPHQPPKMTFKTPLFHPNGIPMAVSSAELRFTDAPAYSISER